MTTKIDSKFKNSYQFSDRESCGLCGNKDLKKIRMIDSFEIMSCADCYFMQTGQLLDTATINNYYENNYGGIRMLQGQQVNATVNYLFLKDFFKLGKSKKVLDVGCGYGFLMHELQKNLNLSVTGVELAKNELEYGVKEFNLEIKASLNEVSGEKYDLITLFEVIEHIESPLEFINEIKQLLGPDGYLIIATDNFNSKIVNDLGSYFPKWIPHQHISLFDADTLPLLIDKTKSLQLISKYSFTPWELLLRKWLMIFSFGKFGQNTFDLSRELETEAERPYPLFKLRKFLNKQWAKIMLRKNLSGEMMFLVAKNTGEELL